MEEFINLLSFQSNEICTEEQKSTISGEHVIKALKHLEFESYIDNLQPLIQEHKERRSVKKKKTSNHPPFLN